MATGSASPENLILAAEARVSLFILEVNEKLKDLDDRIRDLSFDGVTWTPIALATPLVADPLPELPAIDNPTLTLPPAPGDAPELQEISAADIGEVPVNTAVKPTFDFGNMPSGLRGSPTTPEVNTEFDFPEMPNALSNDLPLLAEFLTHPVPFSPELLVPAFDVREPDRPAAPPTDGEEVMARNYAQMSLTMRANVDGYVDAYIRQHSPNYFTQMAAIEAQLAKYLEGGTGLAADVELAIFNRGRERNDLEARRVEATLLNEAASRGFTIPGGALLSTMARARQEAANNNNKTSNEIVVMQAEMEQKNLQFAVTTTNALHDAMRNSAIAYMNVLVSLNGQAMDYAKAVFTNMVTLYNASLAYYATQVEVFKTHLSVFQSKLQAEMAKLEIFKGEIAAFEALNQADKTRAEVYSARLNALNVLAGVYKTQVDTVVAKASLQKLKLELFQAEVQAFGTEAQAKNAEWSGYTARLSGEETKARVYASEISAYNAELDAFKTTISAKLAEIDMIAKTNQALSSNYDSTVRSYVAQVQAESARSGAQNDNNRMVMTEFQKQITAYMADINFEVEKYKAESDAKVKNATGNLSAQIENVQAKNHYRSTLAQLSGQSAQI